MTRLLGVLHRLLVGRGDAGDLDQVARDVFGHAGLFFCRRGDLPVHVADRLYRLGDALQHLPGLLHLLGPLFASLLAAFDGLDRFNRT
ncbi:hypothetical protein D3C81_2030750 [compost metagenome]